MANVLFISETFLKQNTQVSDNVDVKYIRESILWSQDTEIQTILGSTLYNKIKSEIAASTLTGVYKTLVDDYIQIALKHYVTAECLAMATYKITNKGLQIQDSEQSSPASTSNINFLVDKEINKADWYRQRLIDYLCENSSSYPEYQNPDDGVDVIHPSDRNYRTSIYLGVDEGYESLQERYRDV
tara:strand:- start:1740 stop:2294 length:555 start_codon:yes stop_codon:yes gene_type:complete